MTYLHVACLATLSECGFIFDSFASQLQPQTMYSEITPTLTDLLLTFDIFLSFFNDENFYTVYLGHI